ncbi:MAG TPA: DUF1080 domain-containing protein [Lacunisphaera sp.]|nr:DUF1080 domain-containing protein [Lacunisphaera sp.]
MRPLRRLLLPILAVLAVKTFAAATPVELFNGRDLSGWIVFVRPGETPDPATWTVADGVLKCAGKPTGYLRTAGRYKNYRLTVEWRWSGPDLPPDAQGRPRSRNSGVLVHVSGPDAIWPKSIEAQLMQTNAGDIYDIGNVGFAELTAVRAKAVAEAGTDAEAVKRAQGQRRVPRTQPSSEKPVGEWNTYEITCAGETVSLRVNGVEQNRATQVGATEGHIALQAEGAPIEFRNVKLTPLE